MADPKRVTGKDYARRVMVDQELPKVDVLVGPDDNSSYITGEINPLALDDELLRFPAAIGALYENLPTAKHIVVALKEQRDRLYATRYLSHRAQNSHSGIKITEKEIESLILTDPEYQQVCDKLQAESLALAVIEARLDAMRRREACYAMLCGLYSAQYWTLHGSTS